VESKYCVSQPSMSCWHPGVSPHLNLRLPNDLPAPPFSAVARHVPQHGDLLLFPSWLVHSVDWLPDSVPKNSPVSRDQTEDGDAGARKSTSSSTSAPVGTPANTPANTLVNDASPGAAAPEVARASADNVRVSVSFNIGEGWEGTAPVHV